MWHEARKQEKFIRGLIVDYRRRAERRKDFYEQIKSDPTQFLQIHGRKCKIHFEVQNAASNDGPVIMMPWQGDSDNMIDRFDARAYLDYLPEFKSPNIPIDELSQEERQCNYERYRVLAQNAFLGISEEKFLKQLSLEEQFGIVDEKEYAKDKGEKTGAAIGYNYDQPNITPSSSNVPAPPPPPPPPIELDELEDTDLDSMDVDLSIDVNKMQPAQAHELNAVGPNFGMAGCDFFSFLTGDADDVETQKQIMREEREKAMYSGRKSRRERRAHRDKRLADRALSPPSYAAQPTEVVKRPIETESRSPTPEENDKIQFITSFGGEDDEPKSNTSKQSYAEKLKANLKKELSYSDVLRKSRSKIRSRSSSRDIENRKKRVRTNSYRRRSSRSRSSTSRSRSRSRRSRSRSRRSISRSRRSRSRSRRSRSRSRRVRSLSKRSRSRSRRSRSRRSRSRSKRSRSYSRRSRSRSRTPFTRYKRSRSRSRKRISRARSRGSSYRGRSRSRSGSSVRRSSYRRNSRSYSPQVSRGYSRQKESGNIDNDKQSTAMKAPLPRYYGRRRGEDESSSELSVDSEDSEDSNAQDKPAVGVKPSENQKQLPGPATKAPSRETLTLKEKLKKKMQAQLSRQLRADKQAEIERMNREMDQRARRMEEMRELAIKMRRKQRQLRHQRPFSSGDSMGSRSPSPSKLISIQPELKRQEKRSSRSVSPKSVASSSSKIQETSSESTKRRNEEGTHPNAGTLYDGNRYKGDRHPEKNRDERSEWSERERRASNSHYASERKDDRKHDSHERTSDIHRGDKANDWKDRSEKKDYYKSERHTDSGDRYRDRDVRYNDRADKHARDRYSMSDRERYTSRDDKYSDRRHERSPQKSSYRGHSHNSRYDNDRHRSGHSNSSKVKLVDYE